MEDLKKTYDKIAEDWHKDHLNDDWWLQHIDDLIEQLPHGASILDVGCGPGHKSRYFAERGFRVTGVDISERMVEIARHYVPDAQFEVVDMYQLDTIQETFDCVFVCAALLHIPKKDVGMILEKCKSVLKDTGVLCIITKEQWEGQADEEVKVESDYGYEYERFFSYYTIPELEKFLASVQMQVIKSDASQSRKTRWIRVFATKK